MKIGILAVVAMFAMSLAASAQVAPYAMFSASHYSGLGVGHGTASDQSGGMNALGGTFGVNDDFFHAGALAAGGDVRLMIQNSANSTPYGNKVRGFLVGPRLAGNALVLPFRPYVQAELGVVGTNNGTSNSITSSFAYQIQFGADFTIVPHVAVRFEYGAGQLLNNDGPNHTLQSFGTGFVFRL